MNSTTPLPPRSRGTAAKAAPAKKKRKPRRWLAVLFSLVGAIIIVLAVWVGILIKQGNGALDKIALPSGLGASKPIASADRAQVKPLAMLLLGMDTREQTGSMNTDVIMLVAMNPNSNTATVVSVPRDSNLQMEGYKRQKVNAFYAGFHRQAGDKDLKGDAADAYARDEMKTMMSKFFGIPVDYTAIINFQGYIDVVDKLGGINVYVDQDMRYVDNADHTNIDLKKGDQHLNGEQALDFVRYRKSNRGTAASSDFDRNDRQSRVLGAIVDKMMTLGGAVKLPGVIGAVGDNMRTDIPKEQIKNMMKAYYDLRSSDIRFIPLEGEWKSPYVYLNQDKLEEAKRALAEELTTEGRQTAPAASASASAGE